MICNFLCNLQPSAIAVLRIKPLGQKMKEEFQSQAINLLLGYLTLTFDSNAIAVIRNLHCNPHTIDNQCAIYEHPLSKIKVESYYRFWVNLTLTFDSKWEIWNLSCHPHTKDNCYAKYEHRDIVKWKVLVIALPKLPLREAYLGRQWVVHKLHKRQNILLF